MAIQQGEIRGLTLRQPMASAIIYGPKRVENRYTNIARIPPGGLWVVIHAGKTLWPATRQGMIDAGWKKCPPIEFLPRGCALGLAHVVRNVKYDPSRDSKLRSDKWATGPWCLVIDEVIAFEGWYEMPGKQGLWRLPPALEKIARDTLKAEGFTDEDVRELL